MLNTKEDIDRPDGKYEMLEILVMGLAELVRIRKHLEDIENQKGRNEK